LLETVALIYAMHAEAAPLLARLGASPLPSEAGLPLQRSRAVLNGRLEVILCENGVDPRFGRDYIGTEAATLNARETLRVFSPSLVLSVGTAGGLAAKGATLADVYLCDRFFYHDHRIPLPGWEEMGRGGLLAGNARQLAEKLGLKTGAVSSGNSLDFTADDLERIEHCGASVKEMEATAAAWVCSLSNTPFLALKSVTNLVHPAKRSEKEFEKNFDRAVTSLTQATHRFLEYLATAGIAEALSMLEPK